MNDTVDRPPSLVATARQRIRTALELAAQRSADSTPRVIAELNALAAEARTHGLSSIGELAERGRDQAQRLNESAAAMMACARTLRELGRALDALEREAPRPVAVPAAARARRVLVVDDSPLTMAVVCDKLEAAAFETRRAEDGQTAIAEMTRFQPDVVLADVQMQGFTTAELCAGLRAAAGQRGVKVLLYSGLSDDALSEVATAAAADGFVSKEHGLPAVVDAITRACRSDAG